MGQPAFGIMNNDVRLRLGLTLLYCILPLTYRCINYMEKNVAEDYWPIAHEITYTYPTLTQSSLTNGLFRLTPSDPYFIHPKLQQRSVQFHMVPLSLCCKRNIINSISLHMSQSFAAMHIFNYSRTDMTEIPCIIIRPLINKWNYESYNPIIVCPFWIHCTCMGPDPSVDIIYIMSPISPIMYKTYTKCGHTSVICESIYVWCKGILVNYWPIFRYVCVLCRRPVLRYMYL